MALTTTELTKARLFLLSAHASVLWVAAVFFNDGDAGAAVRLNDIAARLAAEIADIDTLMKGAQP